MTNIPSFRVSILLFLLGRPTLATGGGAKHQTAAQPECVINDVDGSCPRGFDPQGGRCFNAEQEDQCRVPQGRLFRVSAEGEVHVQAHWGYGPHNGPATWIMGQCSGGHRQSPVNIETDRAKRVPMEPVHFGNYRSAGRLTLRNNGHGFVVDGFSRWKSSLRPFIRVPSADGTRSEGHSYRLQQFHFHWAAAGQTGSEHQVDSAGYDAELHLVHVREDLDLMGALSHPDGNGLAVVAVFYKADGDGRALSRLAPELARVVEEDKSVEIDPFSVDTLLPSNRGRFFRYSGSLTTPDCNEVVEWVVLEQPVSLRPDQLAMFRALDGPESNVRNIQTLDGGRTVFRRKKSSFGAKLHEKIEKLKGKLRSNCGNCQH